MGRRSGDRPSPAPARGARQRCNHAIGHRGVGDLRQLLGGPPAGPGGLALCSTSEALPRRSQGPSPSLCSVRPVASARWQLREENTGANVGTRARGGEAGPKRRAACDGLVQLRLWAGPCHLCGPGHLPATRGACGAAPRRGAVSSLGMAAVNPAQRSPQKAKPLAPEIGA